MCDLNKKKEENKKKKYQTKYQTRERFKLSIPSSA
jgi:hypothetical protein